MAGELGGGATSFVKTVGEGVVVGTVVKVLEGNGVRRWTPSNRDTCHGLRLFWSGDSAICLVVEEAQDEEFEQGSRVLFGAVY